MFVPSYVAARWCVFPCSTPVPAAVWHASLAPFSVRTSSTRPAPNTRNSQPCAPLPSVFRFEHSSMYEPDAGIVSRFTIPMSVNDAVPVNGNTSGPTM